MQIYYSSVYEAIFGLKVLFLTFVVTIIVSCRLLVLLIMQLRIQI